MCGATMAMGVRASGTLVGGVKIEANRRCRRPTVGAVGAAKVGTDPRKSIAAVFKS